MSEVDCVREGGYVRVRVRVRVRLFSYHGGTIYVLTLTNQAGIVSDKCSLSLSHQIVRGSQVDDESAPELCRLVCGSLFYR